MWKSPAQRAKSWTNGPKIPTHEARRPALLDVECLVGEPLGEKRTPRAYYLAESTVGKVFRESPD